MPNPFSSNVCPSSRTICRLVTPTQSTCPTENACLVPCEQRLAHWSKVGMSTLGLSRRSKFLMHHRSLRHAARSVQRLLLRPRAPWLPGCGRRSARCQSLHAAPSRKSWPWLYIQSKPLLPIPQNASRNPFVSAYRRTASKPQANLEKKSKDGVLGQAS
jgi:hypothetical protein